VKLSPGPERPFYLAMFAAASGLGFAIAAALAGFLASQLPERFELLGETWTNLHVLFLLSALARVVAALPALRIQEPGAQDVRTFVKKTFNDAATALVPRRLTA